MMGYYYGSGWGGGVSLIGGLVSFIFWIAAIVLVFLVIRNLAGHPHGLSYKNSALEILKERYAKGEIDKKEFDEKKKDLE